MAAMDKIFHMNISDDNYRTVRSHFSYLKRQIIMEDIIDELTCLSADDVEDIRDETIGRKKMEVLLKRILSKQEKACEEFIKALKSKTWRHCLEKMQDNLTKRAARFQSVGINSLMLKNCYKQLVEKLPAEEVADVLIDYDVLTIDEHDLIMSKTVRITMAQELMDMILNKPQQSIDILMHVLKEKIPDLVQTIFPSLRITTVGSLIPSKKSAKNTLIVAAIDLGTTYSGVAYSFTKDFGKSPLFIDTLNWDKSGLISMKTPTCLLLDPSEHFAAFGYKAQEQYSNLLDEDTYREWYYFKQFKMILHHQETFNRNTVLQDENGHELHALEVFSHSIRYLKQQLHARLDKINTDVRDDDIHWILTVPAIWNNSAKQFLREAAENAGVPGEQLSLALEPEVASVYVKNMCVHRHETKGEAALEPFSPGTKYMVLDLGGGTIDITVIEVLADKTLKEVHKATVSDWSGLSINRAFNNILVDVFGKEIFEEFKDKYKSDCCEFENDIEMKKRTIKLKLCTKVSIFCPFVLRQLYESKTGCNLKTVEFEAKGYVDKIHIKNDKIILGPKFAESLFDRIAETVTTNVKDILLFEKTHGLRDIVCVGGCAECDIFINKIKERLPKHNIIVTMNAELAVLKGAVLYGQIQK